MITHIQGTVHTLGLDHAVIDVQGIGYHVICSSKVLETLTVSESVFLLTDLVIREDAHLLYGFRTPEERSVYRLLVSVQGVSSRIAMSLLSWGSPEGLIAAIQSGDKEFLCRAEGVGPKLAARLLTELKDRIKKLFVGSLSSLGRPSPDIPPGPSTPSGVSSQIADARAALISLGYKPLDVDKTLEEVSKTSDTLSLQDLIRMSLQALTRRP